MLLFDEIIIIFDVKQLEKNDSCIIFKSFLYSYENEITIRLSH